MYDERQYQMYILIVHIPLHYMAHSSRIFFVARQLFIDIELRLKWYT